MFRPDPKPEKKPKKPKQGLNKKRGPTGEREVFLDIWKDRPHFCTNCQDFLGHEPLAHFFSHIISKKREPRLRLEPTNIRLLCNDCHYAFDFQGIEAFNKRTKIKINPKL